MCHTSEFVIRSRSAKKLCLFFSAFCYTARGNVGGDGVEGSCNAKEGNPFGPFWDTFNIDFVGSEFYGPLHYDIHHSDMAVRWAEKYPAKKWPGRTPSFTLCPSFVFSVCVFDFSLIKILSAVLAFTGAPASFPVQLENRDLHKYLRWSDSIQKEAKYFVQNKLPKGAFVGLHLRNGIDWVS